MPPAVYTVSQLQDVLAPVFKRNGVKKAILFGSYGKGKDVDLFDVSHIEPDSLIDREIQATGVMVYEK